MFLIEKDKLQGILNYLQRKPYRQVVNIAVALVATKEKDNKRVLTTEQRHALLSYLYEQPLGEVFDIINIIDAMEQDFNMYEVNQVPDGFDATKGVAQDNLAR